MNASFPVALAHVLSSEGGYVNNPRDPGGPTNKGVTQRECDNWRRRHRLLCRDVRLLEPQECEALYREDYWNPVSGDHLPSGVDYCVFDFAVNSGPTTAAICLQRAAGVKADGVIGPATLASVASQDAREIIAAVCDQRLDYERQHCDWDDFGDGWSNRVATVEATAKAMV